MTGVAADTSGLGSRLLGVGLDQAISLADQVAMSKVLQNSADNSPSLKRCRRHRSS